MFKEFHVLLEEHKQKHFGRFEGAIADAVTRYRESPCQANWNYVTALFREIERTDTFDPIGDPGPSSVHAELWAAIAGILHQALVEHALDNLVHGGALGAFQSLKDALAYAIFRANMLWPDNRWEDLFYLYQQVDKPEDALFDMTFSCEYEGEVESYIYETRETAALAAETLARLRGQSVRLTRHQGRWKVSRTMQPIDLGH